MPFNHLLRHLRHVISLRSRGGTILTLRPSWKAPILLGGKGLEEGLDTRWKIHMEVKKWNWRFGSEDFPFQLGVFWMNFRKEKTRIEVSMEFRHVQGLWHEGLKIFKLSSTDIYGKASLAAIKRGSQMGSDSAIEIASDIQGKLWVFMMKMRTWILMIVIHMFCSASLKTTLGHFVSIPCRVILVLK